MSISRNLGFQAGDDPLRPTGHHLDHDKQDRCDIVHFHLHKEESELWKL